MSQCIEAFINKVGPDLPDPFNTELREILAIGGAGLSASLKDFNARLLAALPGDESEADAGKTAAVIRIPAGLLNYNQELAAVSAWRAVRAPYARRSM
jgi:hypothetical protein